MSRKIMISQPMKGLTNEQIKANREHAVEVVLAQDCQVLGSVFDFEDIEGIKNKPLFYLAKSFQLIASEADGVYFMEGWEKARGCLLEHAACVAYGIPVYYEVQPEQLTLIR